MKLCPACRAPLAGFDTPCPACGHQVALRGGIPILAPELAGEGQGFKVESFADLYASEAQSFWFQGRNDILSWVIGRFVRPRGTFLEIGCGTGFVLARLKRDFPETALTGSELFDTGLGYARQRLPGVALLQMDARALPYAGEFDGIGAFDVLEHIAEDERVLSEIHRALRPGGHAVLSVPQHPALWSLADEIACHERRYRRGELEAKLRRAGFEVVLSTSFVTILLPLMFAVRMSDRNRRALEKDPTAEHRMHPLVNAVLRATMTVELALIRLGLRLPAGGSRLVVARKPG